MTKFPLKFLLLTSLVFVFIFFSIQNVSACSCAAPETPYQAYKNAKAVFVGKVIGFRNIKSNSSAVSDEELAAMGIGYNQFQVQESLKGTKADNLETYTGGVCIRGFEKGVSYLVYAYGDSNDSLSTGMCTRTTYLESAQDDIFYIHSLLKNKPEPRIYGSVQLVENSSGADSGKYTNLEGIKIIVVSKNRKFETVTDKNGLYSFYKLPNGKYRIYPQLPSQYKTGNYGDEEIILSSRHIPSPSTYFSSNGLSAYAEFFAYK